MMTRNGSIDPCGGGFDKTGATSDALAKATAFLKVLAHERRLEILCQLLDGEHTVGEIEAALGSSQSAVSQQLMRLRAEGVVEARRQGRHIRYRLDRPEARLVIEALRAGFCSPK
jgi:DNA-binding transcriptional ArsR family regulator